MGTLIHSYKLEDAEKYHTFLKENMGSLYQQAAESSLRYAYDNSDIVESVKKAYKKIDPSLWKLLKGNDSLWIIFQSP